MIDGDSEGRDYDEVTCRRRVKRMRLTLHRQGQVFDCIYVSVLCHFCEISTNLYIRSYRGQISVNNVSYVAKQYT